MKTLKHSQPKSRLFSIINSNEYRIIDFNFLKIRIFLFCRELKDRVAESDAACGLGQVYQQMADYETALHYHQADLETAEELKLAPLQGRACGNLGSVYESLGNLQEAMKYQEQHLSIAAQTNDKLAKTVAYSSLGS